MKIRLLKRQKSSSRFKSKSRRIKEKRGRRLQHLCLDKGYKSKVEEQELIKRGYVLHISIKKKKRGEKENHEQESKVIPNRKKYSAKCRIVDIAY